MIFLYLLYIVFCINSFSLASLASDVPFSADRITYNASTETIEAEGHILFKNEGYTLTCERLLYGQQKLKAYDAKLTSPEGSTTHAHELECDDQFKSGFLTLVKARLARPGSTIPASLEGEGIKRTHGQITHVSKASYTPCLLCKGASPTWRLRAADVIHDLENKKVVYKNAWLELKGVPVLYTPYFAHPDPSVKRQSGFVAPGGGWSNRLGFWMRTPYFWDLNKHEDVTAIPLIMDKRLPGAGLIYRRHVERGMMMLGGHAAPNGGSKKGDSRQGWHLRTGARFYLPNNIDRFDFDAQISSHVDDPTRIPIQSMYGAPWALDTTSQITWMRIQDHRAIKTQALTFQSDSPTYQPVVHPRVNWYNYWPASGWLWSGSFLSLSRRQASSDYRPQLQRFSNELSYQKEIWIRNHNLTFKGADRLDVYSASGRPLMQKMSPYASASWKYPLYAVQNKNLWGMQPCVMWVGAPKATKRFFPNEDSTDLVWDDTNILMPNRLQGQVDRSDATHRVVTGIEHSWRKLYASSPRVNFFWGFNHPLRRESTYGVKHFVNRLNVAYNNVQMRYRAVWQKSRPLWNEYGVSYENQKLYLPINYDVGLIRLGPKLLQTQKPLWQMSQELKFHFTHEWSFGVQHVMNVVVPRPYKRRPAVQLCQLSYQDDCASFSLGIYRMPVGLSPTLYDSQDGQKDFDTSKANTKVLDNKLANKPQYNQIGSTKIDKGILFTVSFKELGSFSPTSSNLPPNPSRFLARR